MKERVTLTIDDGVLEQVDKMVDGHKIKNRSHAVELLLLKSMKRNIPRKAVILAGGKGTRLKPITEEIPKPLVPLQGKPIMEHTIDLFKKHGITNILISIGHMGDKIKEYYGNGSKFGINITYIEEDEPLGTAGPLNLVREILDEPFILCNADELKNIDLDEMFMFHKENDGVVTIALTTVPDVSKYGVARLKGNKIIEFIEKPEPEEAPSNLINSGLYICNPEVFNYIPEQGFSMVEKDVFPKLASEGKLVGYPFGGQWLNTGTLEQYQHAIKAWKGLD